MFGYVDDLHSVPGYAPLLYCLGFAIENVVRKPVDFFIRGILTGEGPSGGDPGWGIFSENRDNGRKVFIAWTLEDISGLDPSEGEYDEATVRLHIRRTLDNFRAAHPERANEVDEVITKYGL